MENSTEKRKRAGRGSGSVRQMVDGRWCGRLSYINGAGERKRPTFYGATRREVLDKMRKHQERSGSQTTDSTLTVGDYLNRWLDSRKADLDLQTHETYAVHVNTHLKIHLGQIRLASLTATHVERLYADMAKTGATTSTQRRVGVTLHNALKYAVYPLRLLGSNPASGVPRPKVPRKEMLCLTKEQARLFLEESRSDRLHALYAVWLGSGARKGELLALVWSDINWKASSISITKSLQEVAGVCSIKDTKTRKSRRVVLLPPFCMDALREHQERMTEEGNYRPAGIVFCARRGGYFFRSNFRARYFVPLLARINAGITERARLTGKEPELLPPIRPYDLRHTCASLLIQAGEPIKVVSERLGHTNASITLNIYTHVLPGMQEKCTETAQQIFG